MRAAPALAALLAIAAANDDAVASPDNGTLNVQIENDYFSPNNRDRHYTNGVRLDWLPRPSPPDEQGIVERLARALPLIGDTGSAERVGWSLGQSIFTPQNLKISTPIPKDRPYAGWLYAGLTLIKANQPDLEGPQSLGELDTLETDLGIVGRGAEGKAVQRDFHRWAFSNQDPKGWNNQIKSEPALLISYDHKWRAVWQTNIGGFGIDLTPDVGVDLGNVMIDGSVGSMIRIGRDLPADYGPPRIRPGLAGSQFFLSGAQTGRDFGFYFFGGIEGRAVGHDIFLDGNTFATSLSVPRKSFVADVQAGAALIVYGIRIALSEVLRTQEFRGQHGNDDFGAISMSFRF